MRDLIAKLEKLKGPDREVDGLLAAHFHVKQITGTWPDWCIDPPVTASLDAAIALVERVLPGWDWGVMSAGEDGSEGKLWQHGWHDDTVVHAFHALPAIALIIALLKAKEVQDG